MVQLIVGEKGKGKTKYLLDKVNTEIKNVSGNIAYLDRSTKHMYELNNKVRLIDVSDFFIDSSNEFLGFIAGIISQDHDLQQMYFDGFLAMSNTKMEEFEAAVWAQHGLFVSGPDFDITFGLMHTIEKSAQIWVLQKSTGLPELQTITDDALRAIAKEFGVTLREEFLD